MHDGPRLRTHPTKLLDVSSARGIAAVPEDLALWRPPLTRDAKFAFQKVKEILKK